jgi:hypothetical protein
MMAGKGKELLGNSLLLKLRPLDLTDHDPKTPFGKTAGNVQGDRARLLAVQAGCFMNS